MKRLLTLVMLFGVTTSAGLCRAASIQGKVAGREGPIVGATVRILELDRAMRTGAQGEYVFSNIPPGSYHVFVRALGYASATSAVQVVTDVAEVSFTLRESAITGDEVVISASPYPRPESDQYQSVASKSMEEFHESPGSSFAEEIEDLPGVSVRWNGSASARPILRGLNNNEVLVLENGLRIGDLATFDPAHATPLEPEAVQEVDIVRGPASILYGPNAIGGLVNVITNTIPLVSSTPVTGVVSAMGNSVNDLYSGHFNVVYSDGASAFSISAGGVHSNSIKIPSGTGTYTDPATGLTFPLDTIPQSFIHTSEEGLGYSYQGNFGMIGVGVKHFLSNYGIPGDPVDTTRENPNATPPSGPTSSRIDQEKYSVELRGLFEADGSFLRQIKLNANATDYNHSEFPTILQPNLQVTDSIQNHFHLNGYNTTLQFLLQRSGDFQGTVGIWTDFENLTLDGPQPLGPNSLTTGLAGYVFEEYLPNDNTKVQGALRYDYNKITTSAAPNSAVQLFTNFNESRTTNAVTGSLGIVQEFTSKLIGSLSVGRSFRAPTVQELFGHGPDDASASFITGNSSLIPETGLGLDASLRGAFSGFSFEVSPFLNLISNYIYSYFPGPYDSTSQPTYRIRQFAQTDARLYGAEGSASAQIMDHWALTASGSYVNASAVRDSVVPLPFTPPLKGLLRLNYQDKTYSGVLEWRLAAAQMRLGQGDTPTAGYGVVNIGAGVRIPQGNAVHHISLHCDNLLNQLYRDNLSVIKDFLPQPARGFRINYDLLF